MTINFQRNALDLGIVVANGPRSLEFYRDVLGLVHEGDIAMPVGGGGTMHRLRCGDSLVKLVAYDQIPEHCSVPGGIGAATGLRYLTIHATNIEEILTACEAAGVPVVMPLREIRPGVRIAMVEDPDRNIVEFVHSFVS
jgi:catechol 2,3-dioxygenase-like lactoylglutathione lyase family enzyme